MIEWKKICEIGKRNKGIPITAGQMAELSSPAGNVRVFAAGQTMADICEKDLPANCAHKGPSIIVKSRGHIDFEYYEKPFTHKNELWSYTFKSKETAKFVYYYLTCHTELFRRKAKSNSVKLPQLCVSDIDDFQIPLPTPAEQQRIVDILDTFMASINNIANRISHRRKQHEYYREQLFSFNSKVAMLELNKFAAVQKTKNRKHITENAYSITQAGLVPTKSFFKEKTNVTSSDTSGYYVVEHNWFVYSPSRIDVGSISYLKDEGPVIVSPIDVVFSIDTEVCLPSYLLSYFFTYEGRKNLLKNREGVEGTGRRNLPFDAIKTMLIPLPSISEQQRIVDILDTFEKSIVNLEAQLNERQQQYEYYREYLINLLK